VTGGLTSNPTRWRTFADAVALALGLNVWVSIVLLPGIFVGAWTTTPALLAATFPIVALGLGLWLRSDAVLLLGFPSALLVPAAFYPRIVEMHVYGPVRLAIVAAGLIAYMLGVSFLSSFYEPPKPERIRMLSSAQQPVPVRWRRRFRVYAGLTVLSVVFPLSLVYTVNFSSANKAFLRQLYPGRVEPFIALLNLGVLALWLGLFIWVFLGILRPHRVGDRDLAVELAMLRSEAKRGRPRPVFYVGVVTALAFMMLLLALRYF
jgi:hypothetical protein